MLRSRKPIIYIVTFMMLILLAMPIQAQNRQHIVNPGETLAKIAALYGTTWQDLAAVNHIVNPNLIYVGQVLVIPAATQTFNYVIQYRDTLSTIA
ncbi:MAG TPA: LysM domain-containing protein, partial [Phototrophicaceae bacterium]|nr:LysM domain-containing protein [Phototrophicaceae bacterium]